MLNLISFFLLKIGGPGEEKKGGLNLNDIDFGDSDSDDFNDDKPQKNEAGPREIKEAAEMKSVEEKKGDEFDGEKPSIKELDIESDF